VDELGALLKAQRRRLVAHLAHGLGLAHLGLAEDAVQAASLRALEVWPVEGRPANPAGWLYRTAQHHAIDQLRRAGCDDELPADDSGTPPR
jgi:predicted RNA polymerase sigma factor